VFLKRLELTGFKSFANRTTLDLDPGISVFVGPNGSGKSNIADAVRWVLGEQSARAVRGKQSQDVIFAGSSARQPLGMAEVSLTLDNATARIPLPFAEVRVSRRLYRSGESDYLINGSKVRLRDVVEALTHAGLGPDSYSVIGQGAVDELILQRPEERRIAFEGAADIRRYQAKLAETRSRLESTEQNLTRSQDLVAELEPHLRRLRSQAERAERAEKLRVELNSLATRWYRRRLAEVDAEYQQAERELQRSAQRREALEDELARKEAAWRELEGQREAAEARARDLRPRLDALQLEHERVSRETAVLDERLAQLAQRRQTIAAESQRSQERIAILESDLLAAEAGILRSAREASSPSADVEALERTIRAVERELQDHERERQAHEQQLKSVEARLTQLERLLAGGDARAESLEAETERLHHASDAAATALSALDDQLREEQSGLGAVEECLRREAGEHAQAIGQHASRAQALTALEREIVEADRAVARLEAAAAQLARSPTQELQRPLPALVGPLAEVVVGVFGAALYVPAEYERAISAALGSLVHAFAVANADAAIAIADQLQQADGRWFLAVLPQDSERGAFKEHARALLRDVGLRAFGDELVEAPPEMKALAASFLGMTVLVDDGCLVAAWRRLSDARDLARPWQAVDMSGNVARSSGEWQLGRGAQAEALLSRERERRRVSEELRGVLAQRTTLLQDLERTRSNADADKARLDRSSAEVAALQLQVQLARARVQELQQASRRAGDQQRVLEERYAASRQAHEKALAERECRAAERAPLEAQWSELSARLQGSLPAAEALRRRLGRLRGELAAERSGEAARAAAARAAEELHGRILRELDASREARDRAKRELQHIEDEARQHTSAVAGLRRRLEKLDAEIGPLREALAVGEAELRRQAEARHGADEALAAMRRELREGDASVEMARLARERIADELIRLRREAAESLLADDLEADDTWPHQLRLTLEQVGAANVDDEPILDMTAARRRITTLQRELRSVGTVGEGVLEEYRDMAARHTFLTDQARDLRATMAELRAAITDLESVMTERFTETFARVDAAFQETFVDLFGGGSAQLILTRPDSPLETGVDVIARPPGKRLQGLMSLSGGERALTSVALLFALLRVNPTPFVLLDEVDAALDESNVQRFADMVRTYAQHSQFVVVTHNRATMEIGDALFGVSMEAGGVSKVLSLRLSAA
jgi:chromosome segregation protein